MKNLKHNRSIGLILVSIAMVLFGVTRNSADDLPLNAGDVLIGPCGVPGAMGPTDTNDDFTNQSLNPVAVYASPKSVTSTTGSFIFKNTIQNTGAGDDIFVISAPSVPAGFVVELSSDDGDHYVSLGPAKPGVALPIAYRAAAIVLARITAPSGLAILTGFDTTIRATSTATATASNDTINRIYSGFIRLDKSQRVIDRDSVNATITRAGAEIEFVVAYSNVSSAAGVGNSLLTGRNLVISEKGDATGNKWAATTEHIVGASDTGGGHIIGDLEGSSSLTDIVSILEAGQSGTFKFRRRVK